MKIVITGALGHIGSFVIRKLAYEFPGVHIVMIDNFSTQRYASLFNLPIIANYEFIEGDVSKINLDNIIINSNVVVHLAAITDLSASFNNPDQIESNNYQGTSKVAEACAKLNVPMLYISSTSVYTPLGEYADEESSEEEMNPISPYAVSKLKEEILIKDLRSKYELKSVIMRFGTIFGVSPGMRFHTAVNKFCWQAAMKTPISIWSTAYKQKRPYLDLIDAEAAISFVIKNELFDNELYNVVSLNISVEDVLRAISEFIGDLNVKFVDDKAMNDLSYAISAKKIESRGFIFHGDLRRAVGETISILKYANNVG